MRPRRRDRKSWTLTDSSTRTSCKMLIIDRTLFTFMVRRLGWIVDIVRLTRSRVDLWKQSLNKFAHKPLPEQDVDEPSRSIVPITPLIFKPPIRPFFIAPPGMNFQVIAMSNMSATRADIRFVRVTVNGLEACYHGQKGHLTNSCANDSSKYRCDGRKIPSQLTF